MPSMMTGAGEGQLAAGQHDDVTHACGRVVVVVAAAADTMHRVFSVETQKALMMHDII